MDCVIVVACASGVQSAQCEVSARRAVARTSTIPTTPWRSRVFGFQSGDARSLSLTPGARRTKVIAGRDGHPSLRLYPRWRSFGSYPRSNAGRADQAAHAKGGRVIESELRAGRDTAEWAYERKEVRAAIKHTAAESSREFSRATESPRLFGAPPVRPGRDRTRIQLTSCRTRRC